MKSYKYDYNFMIRYTKLEQKIILASTVLILINARHRLHNTGTQMTQIERINTDF